MKTAAVLIVVLLLGGCASAPPMPPVASLFDDTLFAPPALPVRAADALAVSPAMRGYLEQKGLIGGRLIDPKQALFHALYRQGELKLEYDAAVTRTAAEAFDARAGNCLALVLMTGAFARELGLGVRYQLALGDDSWDRAGDLVVEVGHVNLTLLDGPRNGMGSLGRGSEMTIDFQPPHDGRVPRVRVLAEQTVVAMYLNNRAVEVLTRGATSEAYWWVRAALQHDPELLAAYLTLGVVYRRQNQPALADRALARVVARQPDNVNAMANRVPVLHELGRHEEAAALVARLAQLDPHPPFSYFHDGMAALRAHRLDAARSLFAKEVERAPYRAEFQFWLAVTYLALNDVGRARAHLVRAVEASTSRSDRALYAAKLDKLNALGVH